MATPKVSLKEVPGELRPVMQDVISDPYLNEGVKEMMKRADEFPSPIAAMLVGAGINPSSRRYVEEQLDELWASDILPPYANEVIVGSGIHAAIYCAIRRQMGKPTPLVLEARSRAGGVFAVSRGASFFLNSRNRPGGQGIPGRRGALNFVPGAPVQPSDMGGSEYQTNNDLGWVVRTTLAMNAKAVQNSRVTGIDTKEGQLLVGVGDESVKTKRVIFATGLGEPRRIANGDRFLSFEQFMAKMDDPFPLRGMKRVAVVGGGDSAKTAIEALTGQGPSSGYSVASLDFIEQIDWYGCPYPNCEVWVQNNRSRYRRIGGLLPKAGFIDTPRVTPLNREPEDYYTQSYQLAYVGETPYDYVIVCTGYETQPPNLPWKGESVSRRRTGRVASDVGDVHLIGPAAKLEVDDREKPILRGISENETSIFRYAPRTALLAMSLD